MAARAARRQGSFDMRAASPRGTVVEWRVALK
jgi:hypothetical protein